MSSRNLQKHLPRGLDEPNVCMRPSRKARIKEPQKSKSIPEPVSARHPVNHFIFVPRSVVHLWSPSITAKSYIFT